MDLIRGRGICFGFTQKQKRRFTKETISVKTKLTFDCSEKDRGPTLFHAGQGIPEDEENKESTETGVVTGETESSWVLHQTIQVATYYLVILGQSGHISYLQWQNGIMVPTSSVAAVRVKQNNEGKGPSPCRLSVNGGYHDS